MKYVVTGGAGFIGSHIAQILARNHTVVILDNFSSGKRENLRDFSDSVKVTEGSITDLPLLEKVFEGADGVFHEAALASVVKSFDDPLATDQTNITGTLNVLLAARDCGVKKVVFASSSSVYGNDPAQPKREDMSPGPCSPYAISKLTGEYYCSVFSEAFGVKTAALRYFNVFGPPDPSSDYSAVIPKFVHKLLRKERPVIYGDGKQTRDFVYVRDVVQANILAMESTATGVFNIGSGSRMNLNLLAKTVSKITGVDLPPVHESPRTGDIRDSASDITRAGTVLGFKPAYSLEAGLAEMIEDLKS